MHHSRLREALLAHYDRHQRDLPWRAESDPYRILVSEVMLQQTRVETVLGYYEAWIERFPTVRALAEASEAEVLKAWEGLGYYRRARYLHRAAMMVCERFQGELPSSAEQLREIPGVGEYTVGAVGSIAFGLQVPAVDGNVRRVLARWFDVAEPSAAWLREVATELVDPDRPGDWNQALMDLGATVCTPRAPRCEVCPVSWVCAARKAGTAEKRPEPKRKRAPRPATFALAVLRSPDAGVLMVRRPQGGLLGGMWALPEVEIEQGEGAPLEAVRRLAEGLGVRASSRSWRPLRSVRHRFTHIDATYLPWLLDLRAPSPVSSEPDRRWVDHAERQDLAVPVAQRNILEDL
jgi:A/G-specific adenine glycosylase